MPSAYSYTCHLNIHSLKWSVLTCSLGFVSGCSLTASLKEIISIVSKLILTPPMPWYLFRWFSVYWIYTVIHACTRHQMFSVYGQSTQTQSLETNEHWTAIEVISFHLTQIVVGTRLKLFWGGHFQLKTALRRFLAAGVQDLSCWI